ncbi:hypothetical protein ACFQ4O_05790 [Methylopila musalis]|uniref:Uncharacterized protein n=1 Tax=Methylopila musalis TaxID=1134781 RepID=A0ABW3Z5P5_9HYPH
MNRIAATAIAASLAFAAPARADDIADAIAAAKDAYASGDADATKRSLDLASQLLAQKAADGLARLLPEPPAGWTAEPAETEGSGMAGLFGGGLVVKRTYASGDARATIQLLANSPLLTQMIPLFSNPQLLGAMGKVFSLKGRSAVTTSEGEIQIVAGQTLVTIEGSASAEQKRALAEGLDLKALERFGK